MTQNATYPRQKPPFNGREGDDPPKLWMISQYIQRAAGAWRLALSLNATLLSMTLSERPPGGGAAACR